MRITIDIRLLARGGTTGIPGYTRDLIDTLITEHPEHTYTLFYNAFHKTNALPDSWYNLPHVRVKTGRIPNRLLSLTLRAFKWPTIERLTGDEKPDLIWSPHLDLLTTTKTPQVITVHDLSFLHYPEFFPRKYHLWSWLQNQTRRVLSATELIAVSEFTKSDLISSLGVAAEKISVVYPGVNKTFMPFSPSDGRLAAYRIERKLHKPFILYLGSLEPRKNLPLLVQAFDEFHHDPRFKEYELVLAGRDGFSAGGLRRLVKRSSSRDAIRFLGPVTDEERVLLYNCARVVVFPSWFEGFGFPPLEAQACGVPVIAADRTSLPEILGESALLVDPWKTTALSEAFRAIESDSKLRETIIVAGLANVKRFSWTQAARQTIDTFKRATT